MDVVLFTGKCGSGKDTAAMCLLDRGWERVAFADPVKEMALAVDPFVEMADDPPKNATPDQVSTFLGWVLLEISKGLCKGPYYRLSKIVEFFGWDGAKQFPDVRRFLQRLGTEGVRECIDKDTWIDLAWDKVFDLVEQGKQVVITDCRFDGEAQAFRDETSFHACVYEIVKPGLTSDGHASEAGVSEELLDGKIINDGTIADLHRKVLEIVEAG